MVAGTCVVMANQAGNVDYGAASKETKRILVDQITYPLTVIKAGTGDGTVNGGGIQCGTDCNGNYNAGISVTLKAIPDSYSTFEGWSGSCSGNRNTCTVNMAELTNIVATFTALASDFVVTNITLTPNSPEAGVPFSVKVTVRNDGTVVGDAGSLDIWANQSIRRTCGASGSNTRIWAVGNLTPGQSKTFTAPLEGLAIGPKTLRAFVDSGCGVNESNEDNNQLTKQYAVR